MSGLEVFGAVCGTFQAIEVAHTLWKQCHEFYANKSPGVETMKETATLMGSVADIVQQHVDQAREQKKDMPADLGKAIEGTQEVVKELEDIVNYILAKNRPGSIIRSLRTAWRYRQQEGALESLQSRLTASLQALVSFVAVYHL